MAQATTVVINKGALVKRRVHLANKVTDIKAIVDCFNDKAGVAQVYTKKGASRVWIRYDASVVNIDDVIAWLGLKGIWTRTSWWSRMRLDWYRFEDKNALNNAVNNNSHCCNKRPQGH